MTVNKVILVGNLGADPEGRNTNSGVMVANLRLATTERRKVGETWEDHTEWHRVVCFGRTAENVVKFCQKGKQLYVEGSIRTSEYTDKDGVRRWSTEVVAREVRFLSGGSSKATGHDYGTGIPDADAGGSQRDESIPF